MKKKEEVVKGLKKGNNGSEVWKHERTDSSLNFNGTIH
jgi:hypothetical protein